MTRSLSTFVRAHARRGAGFATAIATVVLVSCGDDDQPPDASLLEQVGAVLCEQQRTEGSVFDGSRVVVLTDC